MPFISHLKHDRSTHPNETRSLVLGFVEDVRQAAFTAILPVKMGCHEDTGIALFAGALTSETGDLAVLVNLVEFEHSELDLLLLMLVLLVCGVGLLLALLGSTTRSQHQMECGFLPC